MLVMSDMERSPGDGFLVGVSVGGPHFCCSVLELDLAPG